MISKKIMFFVTTCRYTLKTAVQSTSLLAVSLIFLFGPVPAVIAGNQVTVIDQGLNMPMSTYTLPKGWKLVHDIATNPNTGMITRYKLDKFGPQGQITRSLPPAMYGPFTGTSFQQAWHQNAEQALQGVMQEFEIGQPQTKGPLLDKMRSSQKLQHNLQKNGIKKLWEANISGKRNGKAYEGKVLIASMPIDQQSGVVLTGILISPRGLLMKTIDTDIKIEEMSKENPRYVQTMQQISIRASKQRMQARQQQFNSHQQMMQQRYQANDQRNQQWMNNFRNDGSSSTGSNGYSSHDAYIDSIHERNTFYDPDSGQNVSRDGQYDYNYTDGMGSYYGTDDPSFNPNSMQGDWQETEPLQPGY